MGRCSSWAYFCKSLLKNDNDELIQPLTFTKTFNNRLPEAISKLLR